MKLFESEGWKSFRLNSLAVILGVVITLEAVPYLSNCRKRRMPEIVGLFKSDVLRHLDMSEGVIADFTTEMYAMRQCAAASGRGELDKVSRRYAPLRPELVFLRARVKSGVLLPLPDG